MVKFFDVQTEDGKCFVNINFVEKIGPNKADRMIDKKFPTRIQLMSGAVFCEEKADVLINRLEFHKLIET